MNSWATASSSSVVTPGAMRSDAAAIARAAIRPATRIRSTISGSLIRASPSSVGFGTST